MFSHILNWKLLKGSHEFPGPDGGTCINEAAIVAAGFEYREVKGVADCPPCFSKPIAAYALGLNDKMPDNLRQELLLPFVTKLAGTASTSKIEQARAEFIVLQTINKILPIPLLAIGLVKEAEACEQAENFAAARAAAYAATYAAPAARAAAYAAADAAYDAAYDADAAARAAAYAAHAAYAANAAYAAYAAHAAADAAYDAAYDADAANAAAYAAADVWRKAINTLDESIKLGSSSEIEIELAVERMTTFLKEKVTA